MGNELPKHTISLAFATVTKAREIVANDDACLSGQ